MSSNFLIMMSDEHSRKVCGAYGNDIVQTPNLDRLAARGTIFANAYTPCPICVPARASFATGQPVHKTRHWDNAHAYAGEPESWAHQLAQAGRDVVSIGKLHYRSADDDLGFLESIEPLYLHGNGDILGCVREPLPVRWVTRNMAEKIGPGETTYTAYDRRIVEAAEKWLSEKGSAESDQPWTAFVSLVAPHFPLIAPQEYFDRYSDLELMPEKPADEDEHPWLQAFKACYIYDNFDDQKTHIALASYYALTTFMDDNVGKVLTALESTSMAENTTVIYVSDHGDNAGERGLWGKSNMYEESAGVPLILAGPGIPAGKVSHTPVTLMDIHPTALSLSGVKGDDQLGPSLVDLARADDDPTRVAFSEYHAAGAASAAYMIRKGRWKYIHYVGYSPQLFNLKTDPEELNDLGYSPDHADIRAELFGELTNICDPIVVDELAKADQRAKIELHGGREAVVGKGSFGATPAPT